MKNRILLQENENLSSSVINQKQESYKAGLFVLNGLKKLGLELQSITDFETDVVPYFKTDFPKSTLAFNLQSRGVEKEYNALFDYYNANKNGILFVEPTPVEIQSIKESYRVYASNKQEEAHALVHSVVSDLNKLKNEFNIPVNTMQSLSFCPVIASNADGLEVYASTLLPYLLRLE